MAKRRKPNIDISINDLVSTINTEHFEGYTENQQRAIMRRLGNAVNKRLKRLNDEKILTPAKMRLEQSGGKISIKGLSQAELKSEFLRAKQFLKSSLSTVGGYRELEKQIKEEQENYRSTGNKTKSLIGSQDSYTLGLAFSYYDVLSETEPDIAKIREKYKIVEYIADRIEGGLDYDRIIKSTMRYLQREYEKNQREYENERENFGNKINNDIPKRFRR